MASNLRSRLRNTDNGTREVLIRRIPRGMRIVGLYGKHLSMAYCGKETY